MKGLPAFSVYSATKAAIRCRARTLTTDLKLHRIRVNALGLGHINTQIGKTAGLSQEENDALGRCCAKATYSSAASGNREWKLCPRRTARKAGLRGHCVCCPSCRVGITVPVQC
jgi:NAD(P)-dependent dehydrogenase (short-subunit alcohol dehydrogenase family)